jgi:hypothetical protein
MFDDSKDAFAKLSIARLQKRIDALKAQQEMLDKFTLQRTLSEFGALPIAAIHGSRFYRVLRGDVPCWDKHRGDRDDGASHCNGGQVAHGAVPPDDNALPNRHLGVKLSQDH